MIPSIRSKLPPAENALPAPREQRHAGVGVAVDGEPDVGQLAVDAGVDGVEARGVEHDLEHAVGRALEDQAGERVGEVLHRPDGRRSSPGLRDLVAGMVAFATVGDRVEPRGTGGDWDGGLARPRWRSTSPAAATGRACSHQVRPSPTRRRPNPTDRSASGLARDTGRCSPTGVRRSPASAVASAGRCSSGPGTRPTARPRRARARRQDRDARRHDRRGRRRMAWSRRGATISTARSRRIRFRRAARGAR